VSLADVIILVYIFLQCSSEILFRVHGTYIDENGGCVVGRCDNISVFVYSVVYKYFFYSARNLHR
jgi:hypothetical protein